MAPLQPRTTLLVTVCSVVLLPAVRATLPLPHLYLCLLVVEQEGGIYRTLHRAAFTAFPSNPFPPAPAIAAWAVQGGRLSNRLGAVI